MHVSAADVDRDGIGNAVDNCKFDANLTQKDTDGDKIGDECDPDSADNDEDKVIDAKDNCPSNQILLRKTRMAIR